MKLRLGIPLLVAAIAAGSTAAAANAAAGSAPVAALQVALGMRSLYAGPIDGQLTPVTKTALVAFQKQAGIATDGLLGPQSRAALGSWAAPSLGSRTIAVGTRGWDVVEAQFQLAWHGFPSGPFTDLFSERTARALRKFQTWARLPGNGVVDAATAAALRAPAPTSAQPLAQPVAATPAGLFGPRDNRFHTGVDFPAPSGAPVTAAGAGRVTYAGWLDGGWGYQVTVNHGGGVRSIYAHLSSFDVTVGERVAAGQTIGAVGSSGDATGPHLHFETRLRGAAFDPMPALAARTAATG